MAPRHLQASFSGSKLFLICLLGVLCLSTSPLVHAVWSRPWVLSHFNVSACEVFRDPLGHPQTQVSALLNPIKPQGFHEVSRNLPLL